MIREPLSPSDEPITPPHLPDSTPSRAWAAVVFAAPFLILSFYHTFLVFRTKAWFTWTFPAAAMLQSMSMAANAYDLGCPSSTAWHALEGVVFPLAPTFVMIACIQTFGRAAWHSILNNPPHRKRFSGFLLWNTTIFTSFMAFSYAFILIGNTIALAMAPDAIAIKGKDETSIKAAYGVVKGGLIVQSLFLLGLIVLVWRWTSVSHDWQVEWDAAHRYKWTWKTLLRNVQICAGLLMVRQIYLLIRFFVRLNGLYWLHFVLDVNPLLVTLVILAVWHPGRCLPEVLTVVRLGSTQPSQERQPDGDVEKQDSASVSQDDGPATSNA